VRVAQAGGAPERLRVAFALGVRVGWSHVDNNDPSFLLRLHIAIGICGHIEGCARSMTGRNSPASMRVFKNSTKALACLLRGSGKMTQWLPVINDQTVSNAFRHRDSKSVAAKLSRRNYGANKPPCPPGRGCACDRNYLPSKSWPVRRMRHLCPPWNQQGGKKPGQTGRDTTHPCKL
jgi:hypothetical protein